VGGTDGGDAGASGAKNGCGKRSRSEFQFVKLGFVKFWFIKFWFIKFWFIKFWFIKFWFIKFWFVELEGRFAIQIRESQIGKQQIRELE